MANRSLEQTILEEQNRVTRGTAATGSKPAGLLDLVRPAASAPANPTPPKQTMAQPAPSSPLMTFAKVAQTMAASPINKGYTTPAPQSPPSVPSSGSGVAGTVGGAALKIFTSGLGLMPLISGLAGVFDGGGAAAASQPLVKYAMPRSIQVSAANARDGGVQLADRSQDGTVRPYSGSSGGSNPASGGAAPMSPAAGQSAGGGPATQVVVNVQAMDSRSFLDHSQEIAQAVRDAMLNMHALNDVVSEL
jgi:hypothetical protein